LLFGLGLFVGCSSAKTAIADQAADNESIRSDEIRIAAGDHALAATLYLPSPRQPCPAVVFVPGAGPAVRTDGYHELGRHFAGKSVAALIYDKRGCGASTGDWTRAGLHDLAEDALALVRFLRSRPDISPSHVGLWGLSQGASIVPIAAGRSADVAFVIAVGGCLDFEGQMRYFRAHVFRRAGLSRATLDIANKLFLAQIDFNNRVRSGRLPAPQWVRDSCRFEFDLDQQSVWRQVSQPVLAIYGERDRQVPPAENAAALAAALKQSGNRDFTLVVYPGASHAIGKTQSGELGEEWTGYVPEYLNDMTDWILQRASGTKGPEGWSQRGRVPKSDQPFSARRYDCLRWYGNAPVQAIQFLSFAVVFLGATVAGIVRLLRGRHHQGTETVTKLGRSLSTAVAMLGVLDLALLAGLVVLARGLANQWEPAYPGVLDWLPLVGSVSACLTLLVLSLFLAYWRSSSASRRERIGGCLFTACALAFVPFLHYWNLLGLALHWSR
jgi:pimeloyl-ACP methyl ester carboxylesterase